MTDTRTKRMLIVDDEPSVAMILAENLEKVDDDYIVETANSGDEALAKLSRDAYTLVITDYKMPGMTGLDLVRAIHNTSPGTQVVLMTAYGTEELRDTIDHLGLSGYLDKPFTMEQIRGIVEEAVGRTTQRADHVEGEPQPPAIEPALEQPIRERLETLRRDTQARCVLLLGSSGYTVEAVGDRDYLDISNVSALVAANFMAAAELARLLGTGSVFKSSYHEGSDYNIYAYDLEGDLLLAVITDSDRKAGMVWFYTKQTASELGPLLEQELAPTGEEVGDLTEGLDGALDEMFGPIGDDYGLDESQLLSLDEAVAEGLVPHEWGKAIE